MADNSIAAELLQQINLLKIRSQPHYLSQADGLTVEEFEMSEYGSEYSLDISNIMWGSTSNDSHVFDTFSEFTTHRDSTKTRLDMLRYVAENNERYKWDCHVLLSMLNTQLDTWLQRMAYWGTKADVLSIYALSDMLKKHSYIVTKHRPWTTVDPSVQGTTMEILQLCPVKLVYLGENRFGRLWRKITPAPLVSTYQTEGCSTFPVFPEAEPVLQLPAPPTLAELETAETLIKMQSTGTDDWDVNAEIQLQEPTIANIVQACELNLDYLPVESAVDINACYYDAMDKIVNHEDISFNDPENWLKQSDCMDIITGRIHDFVDNVTLSNTTLFERLATPPRKIAKYTRTKEIATRPCFVELYRIRSTPVVKLPTLQTNQDLLALGDYFTRSKTKPKLVRKGRRPRTASTNIAYEECALSSDDPIRKLQKKSKPSPPANGPTTSRVHSQNQQTIKPTIRLPPVTVDKPLKEPEPSAVNPTPVLKSAPTSELKIVTKGKFSTRSYALKKTKRKRKYGCKLCDKILDSSHQLTAHHRETHSILYCNECNKAFNNPTSLVRHSYQHKKPRFHCACGKSFAFSSQLQSHSAVHRRHATHHCIYPGCVKSFKHKGDLKRHASEHFDSAHECPDCNYKHHDIRNLESHRLTHTDIEKYICQKCGQKFKFNTQLRRHLKTPNNCIKRKRSDSPEY